MVKKTKQKRTRFAFWLMLVLIWCLDIGKRRRQKKIVRILFLHVIELSFEFSVMSFGLWNGPSVFMMLMNTVFAEIGKFAGAYTDDIETVGEHI